MFVQSIDVALASNYRTRKNAFHPGNQSILPGWMPIKLSIALSLKAKTSFLFPRFIQMVMDRLSRAWHGTWRVPFLGMIPPEKGLRDYIFLKI